jgi:hypothetical protein
MLALDKPRKRSGVRNLAAGMLMINSMIRRGVRHPAVIHTGATWGDPSLARYRASDLYAQHPRATFFV